ncbi:toxin-antitoxin system, toxin component, MazF family [Lentilactobacillus kisonensis F0435]|nr:toxin-antitoxin system, toxin component, MazF family [Lentilactobacillus kisonensis F0435]
MMDTNDVLVAFIAYKEKTGGKTRPVLLISKRGRQLSVFRITSKYQSKSPRIQKAYCHIVDWQQANLRKPSWIDVGQTITINSEKIKVVKIGTLSDADVFRLSEFIEKHRLEAK